MNFLYNIDEKYKYDVYILSITFNYYNKDDVLYPPQLILLCKGGEFQHPQGFIGYNYFKLIFTNPSIYNIYLTTYQSIYNTSTSSKVTTNPQMNYDYLLPFTADMRETQIAPNHYKWEIFFKQESTEKGYIIIYADKLDIKHLDKRPNLNTDKITNQNLHINNIDDKYKYDVEIVSATFNYYKDEDFDDANNDLVNPPQLILLCKSSNLDTKTKEFIGYNYFKLIFIKPSGYDIHVKTIGELDGSEYDYPTTTKSNMNYSYSVPFTFEMIETQKAPNHSKWEISLKNNTKETYITIYSDKLQIKDLKHCPDLN